MDPRARPWPMAVLAEASARLQIPLGGARILRIGHCAVIALETAGLVARVARSPADGERLNAEMRFARYVSAAGLPVLRPADRVSEAAIETEHGAVAFWPLLRPLDQAFEWSWLANTLKRLHGLPVPPHLRSLWDPVGRVEERLIVYRAGYTSHADYVSILAAACARARRDLSNLPSTLGVGLVHGDPLNVIVTTEGPVLLDFDLSGLGPAEWDLVSVAVSPRRFGRSPVGLRQLCDIYGFDLPRWPPFETLMGIRELLDCSFAVSLVGSDPAAARELDLRMRAWLEPDDRSRWTPLPSTTAERRA